MTAILVRHHGYVGKRRSVPNEVQAVYTYHRTSLLEDAAMSQVSGEPPEEHEGLAAFAELKRTIEAAEDLESGFLELRKWLWENVVAHDCLPQDLPEDLKPIH